MKRCLVVVWLWPILLLPVCSAASEAIVELEAVKPGLQGVCVTELAGGQRVEVPLTVLGIIGSGAPEGELVLVRLDDPRFEKTGIIAGMSGSPVYLDGKLLGALAYGWPFATEPIGGVTPFSRMQRIEAPPAASAAPAARPTLARLVEASRRSEVGNLLLQWLVPDGAGSVAPLPVAVSALGGGSTTLDGWLGEAWKRLGWVGSPGGGRTASATVGDVRPGDMVAAVLVDGDATVAAGGTVTEVRGDRLWAFGHASLGAGTASFPLARAPVVAVLPNLMSSTKLFAVGEPIGAVVADRRDGIVGRLGASAPMVPITVTVDQRIYRFRAVDHPVLLPLLAAYLTQSSHGVFGRGLGNETVTGRVDVRYAGLDPAVVSLALSGTGAAAEAAAFVGAVVAYLESSSFSGPSLESIDVELETAEKIQTATILEIVPERRVVRPGDELDVRFRIKPYRGPEQVEVLTLQVPDGLPDGRLDLVGADGAAWTAYDLQMRPRRSADFADEVRLLNSLVPSTNLVAVFERPDVGIALPGGSLSTPPGIAMQLSSVLGPNVQAVSHTVVARNVRALRVPVTGAQRIPLTVRRVGGPLE